MKEILPDSCVKIISESLQSLDNLTLSILHPLVGNYKNISSFFLNLV